MGTRVLQAPLNTTMVSFFGLCRSTSLFRLAKIDGSRRLIVQRLKRPFMIVKLQIVELSGVYLVFRSDQRNRFDFHQKLLHHPSFE